MEYVSTRVPRDPIVVSLCRNKRKVCCSFSKFTFTVTNFFCIKTEVMKDFGIKFFKLHYINVIWKHKDE